MSKSINRVFLLGNLGKDVEVKYTPQGTPVAKLSLATNERYKERDEWKDRTEWHTVILWQRLAEIAGEYLRKGSKILVEGRLRTRSWDKDGIKHYATEIVVTDLVMLDSKSASDQEKVSAASASSGPITDEDIPF